MILISLVFCFLATCVYGASTSNATEAVKAAYIDATPNFDKPAIYQITEPLDHAEGPTWDGRKNMLYFVDIHAGRVFSYNYKTQKTHSITLNGQVSPVIPSKYDENVLIVGVNRTIIALEWDGQKELGAQRVVTTVSKRFPNSRFNDGKADKQGRLWFGTMGREDSTGKFSQNQGILYRVTKDNLEQPKAMIAPVNISNGIAWNKANDKMYYIDSPTRQIVEYSFNDASGEISYNRIAFDLNKHSKLAGVPDGMTADEEDNLWIALFGGGSVIKVNPETGVLLQVVALPAQDVTSTMWGGPNLDILFVTSSRFALSKDEKLKQPAAGCVFAVTNLGTKGLPVFNADVVDYVKRKNILEELLSVRTDLFAPVTNDIAPSQTTPRKRNSEIRAAPLWRQVVDTFFSLF